jgi:hypothetical protein
MEFASIADNCVIDKLGRIACRKGFDTQTINPDILNGDPIEASFVFVDDNGVQYLLCAGNLKLFVFSGSTLTQLTLPAGYSGITANNWQFCQLNNVCYMVQANHTPLKFEPATPTEVLDWTETPRDLPGQNAIGNPNCITAGYGRIFCGDFDAGGSILSWSNLLDGDGYTTTTNPASDSGFYNLEEFWPYGHDETVAIRIHNNFLIIWGKESIILYTIPDNGPVFGQLTDTIEGIGCAGRDTVVPIGQDLFYLDYTGVRSLSRTIQEKSIPIGDVSANIRDDIIKEIAGTDSRQIRAVYDAENSFYAVVFPEGDTSQTFVFDTRGKLENGSNRPTRWPSAPIRSAAARPDGVVYYTGIYGVYLYQGYNDNVLRSDGGTIEANSIPMEYVTHPQTWDQPVNLKFPKQVDVTIVGGQNFNVCLDWAYDYSLTFSPAVCKFVSRGSIYEYNVDEYGAAEYSGAFTLLGREVFNVWGNGYNVRYRLKADVSGSQLSFQEINIQSTFGRIL